MRAVCVYYKRFPYIYCTSSEQLANQWTKEEEENQRPGDATVSRGAEWDTEDPPPRKTAVPLGVDPSLEVLFAGVAGRPGACPPSPTRPQNSKFSTNLALFTLEIQNFHKYARN